MASTRRKAAAVAIAIVGVAGLSLAAAAQLTVNNTTLQAGTSLSAACDADGEVGVAYVSGFDGAAYDVTSMSITGIDTNCQGETIDVTLIDADGNATTLTSMAIGATDPSWDAAGVFDVADIDTVAVAIHS